VQLHHVVVGGRIINFGIRFGSSAWLDTALLLIAVIATALGCLVEGLQSWLPELGRSGDVLIWHAQLLHGGRPILDRARTRASLVVHYWRACDLPADQVRTDPKTGSYLGRTLRGEIRF